MGPIAGNTEPSAEGQADNPRARIAIATLTLLKELYGRGPARVKVYLLEERRSARSLGGLHASRGNAAGELGHGRAVKDQRAVVQQAMKQRFTELIESETGRKVKSLMSDSDQGADASSIVFLLEPRSEGEQRARRDAQVSD